jgi:hypothetical protein
MSLDLTVLAADEVAIRDDMPDMITFDDGRTVVGMAGPEVKAQALKEEGFYEVLTVQFMALIALFVASDGTTAKPPYDNQQVTLKLTGNQYRIRDIHTTPDGLSYIMNLVCPTS